MKWVKGKDLKGNTPIGGVDFPLPKDGKTPTTQELVDLIEPLIPAPLQGEKPSVEELTSIIKPLIPKVVDGKTPTKSELTALIKPLIPAPLPAIVPDITPLISTLEEKMDKEMDKRAETLRKIASRDYDLTELKDVSISSPTNAQVLKYNSTTNKWENGTGGGGGGHTIQDEGISLTQRTNLNFVGTGVTVTDGGAGPDSTIVTIPAGVQSTRAINTTAPLAGGGDLSADRTLTTSMATNKLIGRATAGTGVMEEITLGTNLSFTGTTLNATGGGTITTQEEGVDLSTTVTTLNFVGAGVTASGAGATTTITIPGGGTSGIDYSTPFMFMGA